jgi:hypothetical protein
LTIQRLIKVEDYEKTIDTRANNDLGHSARLKRSLELATLSRASRRIVKGKGAVLDEIYAKTGNY